MHDRCGRRRGTVRKTSGGGREDRAPGNSRRGSRCGPAPGPSPAHAGSRSQIWNPMNSGFVTIVGRPNSGKSTLVNHLVGEKISIVTDKPQTTRNVVRGIVTRPEGQIVLLDTPGVHKPIHRMNERMMKAVRSAMSEVDIVALIVDASVPFGRGDEFTLEMIRDVKASRFLLLNKID